MNSYQILDITVESEWFEQFLHLPWKIYGKKWKWVPPMIPIERKLFDSSSKFLQHAQLQAFIVIDQDRNIVGRITACIDELANQKCSGKIGYFGFYESINNTIVSNLLITAVEEWLKARHVTTIKGPMNNNIWGSEYRFMVKGFETAPYFGEPRNPDYYPQHFLNAGYQSDAIWRVWDLTKEDLQRLHNDALKTANGFKGVGKAPALVEEVKYGDINMRLEEIFPYLMESFSENYEFTPIPLEEFRELVNQLKFALMPGSFLIARDKNQVVMGFSFILQDIAPLFIDIDKSKFKIARSLFELLKSRVQKIRTHRVILHTVTVRKKYRHTGTLFELAQLSSKKVIDAELNAVSGISTDNNDGYRKVGPADREFSMYIKKI